MNLTSLAIIVAFLLTALILFVSSPCYDEDSDLCRGHQFAERNKLASAEDCKYANRPYFDEDESEVFMEGCLEYFK